MSQYEMIDIVDENDNVIKTIERTPEWNAERLDIHRYVNVLVFNSEGKILVQQRSHKKAAGPLRFDTSVGGMLSAGQSYEEAAYKEMGEELGIESPLTFITKFAEQIDGKTTAFGGLFVTCHDGPYSNWEKEAERLEFMEIEEAEKLMERFPYLFTPGFIHALKEYLKAQI